MIGTTQFGTTPLGAILPCTLDCNKEEVEDYLKKLHFFVCNGQRTPQSAHDWIKHIYRNNLPDLRVKTLIGATYDERANYHLHKMGGTESQSVDWDNLSEKKFSTYERFDSWNAGDRPPMPHNCRGEKIVTLGKENPDKLNIMQPFYCVNYIIFVGSN